MSRIRFVEPEEATASTKELFKKLVVVPNLLCIMANSDVVISQFAHHNDNLDLYKLSPRHRKIISLAVSEYNHCPYCIALHTNIAVDNGMLSPEECLHARRMKSPGPKIDALLNLTKELLETRGHISDETLENAKEHNFDDQDIIEIIATIALFTQANYTANAAKPELDYPEPQPINL